MIVVTGLPRSGTSLMMRLLEVGGVTCFYEENFPETDKYNPYGYYEHPDVMSARWDKLSVPSGVAVKVMSGLFYLEDFDSIDIEKVIVMRRNLPAMLASLDTRRVEKGSERGEPAYFEGQIDALRLEASKYPHTEVWFDDLVRNTPNECLRIRNFLDRDLDLAAMAAAVDPQLRHFK